VLDWLWVCLYTLHNVPHTLEDICDSECNRSYDSKLAAYSVTKMASNKVWPTVHRIDDVFGDRNFICSCPELDSYGGD
jgi:glycine dehydrogenase